MNFCDHHFADTETQRLDSHKRAWVPGESEGPGHHGRARGVLAVWHTR